MEYYIRKTLNRKGSSHFLSVQQYLDCNLNKLIDHGTSTSLQNLPNCQEGINSASDIFTFISVQGGLQSIEQYPETKSFHGKDFVRHDDPAFIPNENLGLKEVCASVGPSEFAYRNVLDPEESARYIEIDEDKYPYVYSSDPNYEELTKARLGARIKAIKKVLDTYGPLVVSMSAVKEFQNYNSKSGILRVKTPETGGSVIVVQLVGYGKVKKSGREFWIIVIEIKLIVLNV